MTLTAHCHREGAKASLTRSMQWGPIFRLATNGRKSTSSPSAERWLSAGVCVHAVRSVQSPQQFCVAFLSTSWVSASALASRLSFRACATNSCHSSTKCVQVRRHSGSARWF